MRGHKRTPQVDDASRFGISAVLCDMSAERHGCVCPTLHFDVLANASYAADDPRSRIVSSSRLPSPSHKRARRANGSPAPMRKLRAWEPVLLIGSRCPPLRARIPFTSGV